MSEFNEDKFLKRVEAILSSWIFWIFWVLFLGLCLFAWDRQIKHEDEFNALFNDENNDVQMSVIDDYEGIYEVTINTGDTTYRYEVDSSIFNY